MSIAHIARCGVVALIGVAGVGPAIWPAQAEEPNKAELDALRQSLAKYEDVYAAVRDLYLSTVGCVYYNGEKIDGHMYYPKGAMGVHFVNVTVRDPVADPMRPNVLIYEPDGQKLRLVAAEWLVPLTSEVKEPPKLFGQTFQGPMEGHYPLIPKEFLHYDLHVWLKDNPLGMFSPTNPDVKCDDSDFALLEQPTKMVHQK